MVSARKTGGGWRRGGEAWVRLQLGEEQRRATSGSGKFGGPSRQWEEEFSFYLEEGLLKATLRLRLYARGLLGREEFLGQVGDWQVFYTFDFEATEEWQLKQKAEVSDECVSVPRA